MSLLIKSIYLPNNTNNDNNNNDNDNNNIFEQLVLLNYGLRMMLLTTTFHQTLNRSMHFTLGEKGLIVKSTHRLPLNP